MSRIPRNWFAVLTLLAAGVLTATVVVAADKPNSSAAAPMPMPTSDREAAAIQFVRDNHPDLVELLARLKDAKPNQYADAINQLFKTSQRLAQLREQDPQRYQLELEAWKVKSRLQLLMARVTTSPDQKLDADIRAALTAQADVQLRLVKLERDRVADRLAKLNATVQQLQSSETANVQKQFEMLMREVAQAREKLKRDAAAASSKPATSTNSQTIPPPAHKPASSAEVNVKAP